MKFVWHEYIFVFVYIYIYKLHIFIFFQLFVWKVLISSNIMLFLSDMTGILDVDVIACFNVEVKAWMSNYIPHKIINVITYPCSNRKLTHWVRVTHVCVNELTIISSDNGLSPGRRQAITWTNAGILVIGTLGINFSEIYLNQNSNIFIQENAFENVIKKLTAIVSQPQCVNHVGKSPRNQGTVRETKAHPLANASAFLAGWVENWPGWVEFCIDYIRGICFGRVLQKCSFLHWGISNRAIRVVMTY